jgi:hypothetical protein
MKIERRYREGEDGDNREKFEKEILRNVNTEWKYIYSAPIYWLNTVIFLNRQREANRRFSLGLPCITYSKRILDKQIYLRSYS